jgi:hypothetical protein
MEGIRIFSIERAVDARPPSVDTNVEETLRIAIREALRRVPSEEGPKGIPVVKNDATDAYGGALGSDPSPIVSEADLILEPRPQ